MAEVARTIGRSARRYPIFALFLLSYTATHLLFEYSFWFADGEAIFGKYAEASDSDAMQIAQRVYFAKATWMFALVWLLVLRFPLRAATTYSFLLYALELLFLFEPRLYLFLNLLLAVGLLIELWLKPAPRRPVGADQS